MTPIAVPISTLTVFRGEPPRRRRNVGHDVTVLILDIGLSVNMNDVGWSFSSGESPEPGREFGDVFEMDKRRGR